MKRSLLLFSVVALVALAAGGGYWLGQNKAPSASAQTPAKPSERKVLYYRNPMGLADTSPVPKKDSMGMDYIPVFAGDAEPGGNAIQISIDRVQKLGVKSEAASLRELNADLRVTGRIE